jgi:hypothetical protein
MYIKITNQKILIISICFAFLVDYGIYGFGTDYYAAYYKANLNWGGWNDKLGYKISTLTFFNKNYGVFIVSSLLCFSFGALLKTYFEIKNIQSFYFFILILILGIHTWPIIMSTSNAMRQGITMSLIFLSLNYMIKEKNLKSLVFIFISIFTHKSGIMFFVIYLNIYLISIFLKFLKKKYFNVFVYIVFGIINFYLFYYIIQNFHSISEPTRIIQKDYRYHFATISLIYLILFTFKSKILDNRLALYLYLFIFVSFSVLFYGLNFQYERLMMMMTIPFILVFGIILNKRSLYPYLIISISGLLLLTIYNGMYNSLV